uniref:Uncharacterized protein n=1 Tax=Trichogramma kaykai TaxID=54128 RepID=A0ABD2VWH1_9HYME
MSYLEQSFYFSGTKHCYEPPFDLLQSIREALNEKEQSLIKESTESKETEDPSDKPTEPNNSDDEVEQHKKSMP